MHRFFPHLIVGFVALVVALFAFLVWDEATAEHFELRKDSWRCTASHQETITTFTQVGQVSVPLTQYYTVCDQWTAR